MTPAAIRRGTRRRKGSNPGGSGSNTSTAAGIAEPECPAGYRSEGRSQPLRAERTPDNRRDKRTGIHKDTTPNMSSSR